MKSYNIYVCEVCGKESKDRAEIQSCEAGHFGLTWLEYLNYRDLKDNVVEFEHLLADAIEEGAEQYLIDSCRKAVENATTAVADFEAKHGLKA